ncbi:TniQ family protein [Kocuria sp. CPCC 205300]|uniref:TniQ family protein n=1 Tax=Kocuria sabuli TaxID=3071448 RepID=UPI0036DEFA06
MSDHELELLPVVPIPAVDEALDAYLERMTSLNGLTRVQTKYLLNGPEGTSTTRFLILKPVDIVVERIIRLTGLNETQVRAMTLQRFDHGLPLYLAPIDPTQQHSLRLAIQQGWFPPKGTQVCSLCLAQDRTWRLQWRLPHLPICDAHGVFFMGVCPECGRGFRSNNQEPLKGHVDHPTLCGNPNATKQPCTYDLTRLPAVVAEEAEVVTAHHLAQAISGQEMYLLDRVVSGAEYLNTLRQLATLLLHLAAQSTALDHAAWVHNFQATIRATPTGQRGPRWGLSPPADSRVRGAVLTEARLLLEQPASDAAQALRPWMNFVPSSTSGVGSWIASRAVLTPELDRLARDARAPGRTLAHQLQDHGQILPPQSIPQLIPTDPYNKHLAHLVTAGSLVGRRFAALCLARTVPGVRTWDQAGAALGFPDADGWRIAQSALLRTTTGTTQLREAIAALGAALDPTINYRARETYVRALAQQPDQWFRTWRKTHHPNMRFQSLPYLITWFWESYACGDLSTSPAWRSPSRAPAWTAYRAFIKRAAQDRSSLHTVLPIPKVLL